MTDRDRFRGQDPDHEYGQDEYPTQDEMSSSMGGYDESSMQQDQGGWASEGEHSSDSGGFHGQDEGTSSMDESGIQSDMQSRRPGEGRGRSQEEDEFGDDEPGGHW